MNPRHLGDRGAPANVDENPVGLHDFIIDRDRARRLKAGMALNDAAILKSPQPFLDAPARPPGNFIFAGFDPLHIHAHVVLRLAVRAAIDSKTIFGTAAGHMGRIRAGHHRLGRGASRIHAGAAKLLPFNNGDSHARGRKPRRQGRASLARPDDDGVVVVHLGSSSPVCSRTMYSAYQSGQFASAAPMRFSCSPWATDARRIAFAKSLAELNEVTPGSTRPGSRVVPSCSCHWLPSGSLNVAREK